jgi:hypothetical protein
LSLATSITSRQSTTQQGGHLTTHTVHQKGTSPSKMKLFLLMNKVTTSKLNSLTCHWVYKFYPVAKKFFTWTSTPSIWVNAPNTNFQFKKAQPNILWMNEMTSVWWAWFYWLSVVVVSLSTNLDLSVPTPIHLRHFPLP